MRAKQRLSYGSLQTTNTQKNCLPSPFSGNKTRSCSSATASYECPPYNMLKTQDANTHNSVSKD